MAVKGKSTVQNGEGGFKKYVGVGAVEILAINPDAERIEQITGKKPEEDPSYTGEDKKGNDMVKFAFWMKEESTGKIFNCLKMSITDKERPTSKKGQTQFINNIGYTAWAKSEDDLKANFSKRDYRVAKMGEETFYEFMNRWLCLDGDDAELEFNLSKLMRGNFRELDETVKSFEGRKVVVLFTINTVEKDGETVEYQNIYPYSFLPYETMSGRTISFFEPDVKRKPSYVDYFITKVSDEKFGCKDFYKLAPFQEYNPAENILSSDTPIQKLESEVEPKYENSNPADDLPF